MITAPIAEIIKVDTATRYLALAIRWRENARRWATLPDVKREFRKEMRIRAMWWRQAKASSLRRA